MSTPQKIGYNDRYGRVSKATVLSLISDALVDYTPGGVNSSDVGYDLIVMLGQSNAVGLSGTAAAPTTFDSPDPRVYVFEGDKGVSPNQIRLASDPLYHLGSDSGFIVGPGLNLGRFYARTIPVNRTVLLVPCAADGTQMVGANAPWNHASSGLNLPQMALQRVAQALAVAGPNARVAAFTWNQGESDAVSLVSTATYQAALVDLIDWMRSNMPTATQTTPFVVGGLVPDAVAEHMVDGHGYTYRDVDAGLRQVATLRAHTQYAVAPVDRYNHDSNHFSAAGSRDIGERLARAIPLAQSLLVPAAQGFPQRPLAPTDVADSNVGGSQFDLAWSAAARAVGYFVTVGSPAGTVVSYTSAPLLTVKGLSPGSTYTVRVSAVNDGGVGDASDPLTVVTPAPQVSNNVVDGFHRANSFDIGAGSSGPAAEVLTGQGYAVAIAGNKLQTADTAGHAGFVAWDVQATDLTLEVVIEQVIDAHLDWRIQDVNNRYFWQSGGNVLCLVQGNFVYVGNGGAWNGGDTVKIVLSGSTFKFYINGTLTATYTDSTFAAGLAGFGSNGQGGFSLWDSVKVTAAQA